MSIFGKKKKEAEEDALIEKLTRMSETRVKDEGSKKGSSEAAMEKLGAQISALREVLQAQQERFERQSEEIGELRSALAEREKHMRDIESKAMKASELVEDVQPEKLMSEQKKSDAKIEAIRAKIENSELVSNSIIEELKKMKGSVSIFRGIEDVIKLNKEIQDELRDIKKIEANVERHADHVEAMFSSFESNFSTFEKMKDGIKYITQECDFVKKENEKNSVAIKGIPKKDEFYQAKKEIKKMLNEINNEKQIYSSRNAAIESKAYTAHEIAKKLESGSIELKNELFGNAKKLSDIDTSVEETLEKIKKLETKSTAMKHEISSNAQKLNEVIDTVEKAAKIISGDDLNDT